MKKYEAPLTVIVSLSSEDVICASAIRSLMDIYIDPNDAVAGDSAIDHVTW